jgi:hypothetical protein
VPETGKISLGSSAAKVEMLTIEPPPAHWKIGVTILAMRTTLRKYN